VRVVAGAVAVLATKRPELRTSGARVVPDQVATVNLGRFVVLVTKSAVVFHQLVDRVAVGVDAVEKTRRPANRRRRWRTAVRGGVVLHEFGRRH